MKILLVSLNYSPEPTGIGLYSGDLARELAARGHDVSVVCAQPHYPQWKVYENFEGLNWRAKIEDGVDVLRCPLYVPQSPGGAKRIVHYLSFALSSAFAVLQRAVTKRPDIIINVAPSLLGAPMVFASSMISGAKSWLHVQDFEVEAAFATGHLDGNGPIARFALWLEKWFIKCFDATSSISPEMCAKLIEKGADPAQNYQLRNWAALDHVSVQSKSTYSAKWGLGGKKVVLYSGTLSSKQGIEIIAEMARLSAPQSDLHFVVCGEGPSKKMLQDAAQSLPNLSIYDLQPMEQLGELMALANVHILPQKADAADLVLPSKLTNMLASGRPVVVGAHEGTGLAREVEGCGIAVEPESPVAMLDAISILLGDSALHASFSLEARHRAEQRWSKDAIISALESRFADMCGPAIIKTQSNAITGPIG
jgi:colanic acid biosynthesis glycosyl transferase WcaI